MGHRHRRAPGRRRQLEQRLVAVRSTRATRRVVEPSGDACDSTTAIPKTSTCSRRSVRQYRFSVEWSRIEPEEGEFSRAALDHYRRMSTPADADIDPVVTFHHFTTPRWLVDRGRLGRPTRRRFARFCDGVAAPRRPDRAGAARSTSPTSCRSRLGGRRVPARSHHASTVLPRRRAPDAAHRKAVDVIKSGAGRLPVGLTLSMGDWVATDGGEATSTQSATASRTSSWRPPRRRLHRRAGVLAHARRARRRSRSRAGVPVCRWATSTGRRHSAADAPGL